MKRDIVKSEIEKTKGEARGICFEELTPKKCYEISQTLQDMLW